jgi:DNA-binding LacI/PurR family transcriptional regulator
VLGLGHRRIGVISFPLGGRPRGHRPIAPDDLATHRVTRGRLAGYREAVAARGGGDAVGGGGDVVDGGGARAALAAWEAAFNDRASGEVAAGALLDAEEPPTVLLCMSDELAIGALAAAAARGLAVPGDLSVVGWDDTPEAARAAPPLTTIRQSLSAHGRLCAELAASAGPLDAAPRAHLEPWELVVRGSTGPA